RVAVAAQLGDPAPAVVAVRIEALALPLRVQDPEPGSRVDPGAGDPLPVALVLRGVVVDEERGEMLLAAPPVDVQVLDEEARSDHPDAVVHPPGRRQPAHPGVDQGEARLAAPPALEALARWVPARLAKRRVEPLSLDVLEPGVPGELFQPLGAALAR